MLVNDGYPKADVLVFTNDTIVLTGVKRLLGSAVSIVTHSVPPDGEMEIINKLQALACDTLIVDSSLIQSGRLHIMKLLECKNSLKILLLNTDSNDVLIFEKKEKRFHQPEDLHALIIDTKAEVSYQSQSLISA